METFRHLVKTLINKQFLSSCLSGKKTCFKNKAKKLNKKLEQIQAQTKRYSRQQTWGSRFLDLNLQCEPSLVSLMPCSREGQFLKSINCLAYLALKESESLNMILTIVSRDRMCEIDRTHTGTCILRSYLFKNLKLSEVKLINIRKAWNGLKLCKVVHVTLFTILLFRYNIGFAL